MKNIFKILGPSFKKKSIFLLFLMVVSMLLEIISIGLVFPLISNLVNNNLLIKNQKILNIINDYFDKSFLGDITLILIGVLLLAMILKNLIMIFYYKFEGNFIYRFQENLSFRIFKILLNKEFLYHINSKSSDLIAKTKNEVQMVTISLTSCLILLSEVIVSAGIILLLVIVEPIIFLQIFVIISLCTILFYKLFYKKIKAAGVDRKKFEFKRQNLLTEGLNGIRELRIFGLINKFQDNYEKLTSVLSRVYANHHFFHLTPKIFLEISAVIIILLICMINFEDLNDSTIKNMLPIIGLYFTASYRLLPSLNRIMGAYNHFRFAKLGVLGIFNELKNQNKSTYEESTERINDFKILKFDNVNFHYAEEEKVLESVNFEIEKGDKVLIQGETGSGKSTVLNLIFGLIKPTGGKITFNGKQIKLNDILKSNLIGYTPQNTHLLDGTLQFNVSLEESSEKIDHKKLTQILKICELKGFLDKLEKKIELNVGESGKMLSGGQKQRVGLARAIYKNPQILIFDESTSSLDKKTEKLILKKILENFPHKTMIFVSHDLNLIEQIKFNKIVKL